MDLKFRRPQKPVARQYVYRSMMPDEQLSHKQLATQHMMSFPSTQAVASFVGTALTSQKTLDFAAGAKTYKKRQLVGSIARGFIVSTIIVIIIAAILGSFGFVLNKKYHNRALPFSYIGDISVGGLTQVEIKNILDSRAKAIDVKFVDGNLIKTTPLSTFDVKFDTDSVSKQVITNGFSPFAYLNRKRLEVPVFVNERQVDGYLRLNVYNTQTKSENAVLYKDKNKLAIKPEVMGFRSDPSFITNRIKIALATMSEPVINVNAVTVKPSILKSDLEDDLAKANKLLAPEVTIKAGYVNHKVSNEQKISWLQLSEAPGTKNLNINYNKTLIRQYVNELAQKYQQTPTIDELPVLKDDGAVPNLMQKGTRAFNIDEITENIYNSLKNYEPITQTVAYKSTLIEPQKAGVNKNTAYSSATTVKPAAVDTTVSSLWR